MARKYQHVQELLPQIKEMMAAGMTQSEVEKTLGLTGDRPVHALLKRERKRNCKECQRAEAANRQRHCRSTSTRTND